MSYRILLCALVAWMLASTGIAQAQTEPSKNASSNSVASASGEPRVIFKRLHDYVKSTPLDFETSFDARTLGEELYRGSVHFQICHPNLLRIETSSGRNAYVVISDGKVMTIYDPKQRKFAQTTAPEFTRCSVWIVYRRIRCRGTSAGFSQGR